MARSRPCGARAGGVRRSLVGRCEHPESPRALDPGRRRAPGPRTRPLRTPRKPPRARPAGPRCALPSVARYARSLSPVLTSSGRDRPRGPFQSRPTWNVPVTVAIPVSVPPDVEHAGHRCHTGCAGHHRPGGCAGYLGVQTCRSPRSPDVPATFADLLSVVARAGGCPDRSEIGENGRVKPGRRGGGVRPGCCGRCRRCRRTPRCGRTPWRPRGMPSGSR